MHSKAVSLLAAAALLAACGDSGPGPAGGRVTLAFTSGVAPAPAPAFGGYAASAITCSLDQATSFLTCGDGSNTLEIRRVEIVLRDIELERMNDDSCDDLAVNHELCEKFQAPADLLTLPLGRVDVAYTIQNVDPDIYDEVEFKIHKISEDDPGFADFRARFPTWPLDQSIRVSYSWNGGAEGTYLSDLNVGQEHAVLLDLRNADNTPMNVGVTVQVDVTQWFVNGTSLVDPGSANKGGGFENLVRDNIQTSIQAFEDDDHDGRRG